MATLQQIIAYLNQYKAKFPMAALKAQLQKQGVPPALLDQAIQAVSGQAAPPGGGQAPAQPQRPAGQPAQPQQPGAQRPAGQPAQPQQPARPQPPSQAAGAKNTAASPPGKLPSWYVPPKGPIVPPPPGRAYMLVVDDDPLIRDMLVQKMEGAGFRVTCAEDAAQSVIQAEGMRLAVLISDIEMPGFGTGVDALRKLRSSPYVKKNLPVIFVTGMPPNEAKKIVPATDPYVRLMHKPVDWNLLRQYIKDLTGMDKPL